MRRGRLAPLCGPGGGGSSQQARIALYLRRRVAVTTPRLTRRAAAAAAEPFPLASAVPVPPVQVAYTAEEIDRCVATSFAASLFVGFDTEYRPTFQKDVSRARRVPDARS
jgi:hypothetical protein